MELDAKNEKEKKTNVLNEIYNRLGILSEKEARDETVTFRLTLDGAEKLSKEIITKIDGKATGVITITEDGQVMGEKFEKENKSKVNPEDDKVTMIFSFDNAEKLAKEIMKSIENFCLGKGFVEIISSNKLSGVTVWVRQSDVDKMCVIDYHDLSYLMTTSMTSTEETTRCFVIKYLCREEIIDFFEENEYFSDMKKIEEIVMGLSDDEVYNLAQSLADCLEENSEWHDLIFNKVCMEVVKEKLGEKEAKKMELLRKDYTVIDKNFDDLISSLDKDRSEQFHKSYSKSDKMICRNCESTFLLEEVILWFMSCIFEVSPTCTQCYSENVEKQKEKPIEDRETVGQR